MINEPCFVLKIHFDPGDCCLPEIDSEYCIECICHEDGTRHPDAMPMTTTAGTSVYGYTTKAQTWYTVIVYTYTGTTPWANGSPPTKPGIEETTTEEMCPAADIGDGYCDDSTNIKECNYDGGDCCNVNSWYLYCKDCICHPEAPQNPNEKKIDYSERNDGPPIICYTCSASSTLVALKIGSLLLIISLTSI